MGFGMACPELGEKHGNTYRWSEDLLLGDLAPGRGFVLAAE